MSGVTLPKPLEPAWIRRLPDYLRDLARAPTTGEIAAADASGILTVLSAEDGESRQQAQISNAPVTALEWPRQDRLIAATDDGTLAIVDPSDSLRIINEVDVPGLWIEDLALYDNRVAFCSGRQAFVASLHGEVIWKSPAHDSTVSGVAFIANTPLLATSCYGAMRIWNIETGELHDELSWKGSLFRPHPSPDGGILACGCQDDSVHFWRLTSGRDSQMSGFPGKPRCLAWSSDSGLLATSSAHAILVWSFIDGPEGTTPSTLGLNARPISALSFHPSEKLLLSGAEDGLLFLWDPTTDDSPQAMASMFGEVSCVQWASVQWATQETAFFAGDSQGHLAAYTYLSD